MGSIAVESSRRIHSSCPGVTGGNESYHSLTPLKSWP
jgi:hypothetical protein